MVVYGATDLRLTAIDLGLSKKLFDLAAVEVLGTYIVSDKCVLKSFRPCSNMLFRFNSFNWVCKRMFLGLNCWLKFINCRDLAPFCGSRSFWRGVTFVEIMFWL